jgi:hypothetical protein
MHTALALGLIVVVLAIVAWAANRRRNAAPLLELKLSLVGFETSGKTVFVGCMFNELRVPDEDGVFLYTPPEKAGKLLKLYKATADTSAEFPVPTSKAAMLEWPFTVKVRSGTAVTDVVRLSYLDFSGESLRDLFNDAPNPATHQLYERFKASDVLMAALDGLQVKRYMENRPLPNFYDDLGTLLALLSNHPKPVNLVLTKWDILQDHYTLQQVIEQLLEISQFAKFVRSQRMLGTCRLIPVSSVGKGFVVEKGDEMRKVPGQRISPVRVELPIACALPDALAAAEQQKAGSPRSVLLAWAQAVKVGIGPIMIGMDPYRDDRAQSFLSYTQGTPAAVAKLITYCGSKMTELNRQFPESFLSRSNYRPGP